MVEAGLDVELKGLDVEIANLLQERLKLIESLKSIREERRKVITGLKEIQLQIKAQRESRASAISEIKQLVGVSREVTAQIRESREELQKSRRELSPIGRIRGESLSDIERAITELEWRLQTERLSREQEKSILIRIKELHIKRAEIKQKEASIGRVRQISEEVSNLSLKMDEIKAKIEETKKKADRAKEALLSLLEKKSSHQNKLGMLNSAIQEKEAQLATIQTQLDTARAKRRELIEAKHIEEAKKARERIESIINDMRNDIKSRLTEGKKVSLEELKLLFNTEDEIT